MNNAPSRKAYEKSLDLEFEEELVEYNLVNLVFGKKWYLIRWDGITVKSLMEKGVPTPIFEEVAKSGQIYRLPMGLIDEDMTQKLINICSPILLYAAESGELKYFKGFNPIENSRVSQQDYLYEILAAAIKASRVKDIPSPLMKRTYWEGVIPSEGCSAISLCVRKKLISYIPNSFLSLSNLLALDKWGKNIITALLPNSVVETDTQWEKEMGILLGKLDFKTLESLSILYPNIRTMIGLEKMRREVAES